MSGNSYLLDTNILVYALKGNEKVLPYFEENCYISVVSEIEIMGVTDLNKQELSSRKSIVNFCYIVPLTNHIKNAAIRFKQQVKSKIPDAIIAATV